MISANLREKEYARDIERDTPAESRRAGTDSDPPRIMFKGLGARYAGGGLSRRERSLYIGGGVAGTAALFVMVLWLMSLF